MFESLQQGMAGALKTLSGKGKLTEANMREAMALVQTALLEADVSFSVVKDFVAHVTEQAIGEKVLASLNPSQQVIGFVHQELINMMGPVDNSLHLKPDLTVLMMCGLQGSGKTTTCGKLARMIHERGASRFWSRPTCSVRRPSTSCTSWASNWACRSIPSRARPIR